jgi:hypothetical protein
MRPLYATATIEARERFGALIFALLVATTVATGFGSWALRGRVSAPVPPLVIVHGAVFFLWLALFVTQIALVTFKRLAWHRRLGWAALALSVAMVGIGALTAMQSVHLQRVPKVFSPALFLALSFLEVGTFALLVIAAMVMALRHRSDWHRRLMLGAMVAIVGPAWGRILPMDELGAIGGVAVTACQLSYVGIVLAYDWWISGRYHPSYNLILAAILVQGIGTPLLGSTSALINLARSIAA